MVSLCSKQQFIKPSEFVQQGYTKGVEARDSRGNHCSARSPNAVMWCAIGAVNASIHSAHNCDDVTSYYKLLPMLSALEELINTDEIAMRCHGRRYHTSVLVSEWNDNDLTSRCEVIRFLQKAEKLNGL